MVTQAKAAALRERLQEVREAVSVCRSEAHTLGFKSVYHTCGDVATQLLDACFDCDCFGQLVARVAEETRTGCDVPR